MRGASRVREGAPCIKEKSTVSERRCTRVGVKGKSGAAPGHKDDDEGEDVAAVEVVEVEEQQRHPHERGHVALRTNINDAKFFRAKSSIHSRFEDFHCQ